MLPQGPSGVVQVGQNPLPLYFGLIRRIEPTGFGIIVDAAENEHPFTFDAITGYRGEPAAALGLSIGRQVKFAVLNDRVAFVEPYHRPNLI